MARKRVLLFICFLGFIFSIHYIRKASCNIIYGDYIRIVCNYLPDYYKINKYIHLDILTRTPASFFIRLLNIKLFNLNTQADMVFGIVGSTIFIYVVIIYGVKSYIKFQYLLCIVLIGFGLNKWEMILNGTGNIHFWAIALEAISFYQFDKTLCLKEDSYEIPTILAPPFITLFFAGDYCIPYLTSLLILCSALYFKTDFKRKVLLVGIIESIVLLILYSISRFSAVYEIRNISGLSLIEIEKRDPLFFIKFIINAFGSSIYSIYSTKPERLIVALLGIGLIIIYIYIIHKYIKNKLYLVSIFPFFLVCYSLISYILIFIARYMFFDIEYGMSSRYQIQYQMGTIGLILILQLLQCKKHFKIFHNCIICIFLTGSILSSITEYNMAIHRKNYCLDLIEKSYNLSDYTDEDLETYFQYGDANKIRSAFEIIKEQRWNIYDD